MSTERELIQQIQSHLSNLVQGVADAQFWRARWIEQSQQENRRRTAEIETKYQKILADAKSDYESTQQDITRQNTDLTQFAGLLAAPWSDPAWQSWKPANDSAVALVTRIGQLLEMGKWDRLVMPALVPLINNRPLLFKASGAAKPSAALAIQSLLLRLLATIPPGKLRFTFIDPIGLGQNVASFMHLADYDESLVTSKAWTEPQHIEHRLTDLTEHMENVIQKYLRNQFTTIEEYNAQAGEVAEPYRVLVVFDFSANFSEAAARRLVSIAQNGPRCGVYAVILADTAQKFPYNFSLSDVERACTVIGWDNNRFVWQDDDFKDCALQVDTLPTNALIDRILSCIGEAAKDATKVEVPFAKVLELAQLAPGTWWRASALNGIQAPLGPAGARKLQYLDLGKGTAQHALVAGKTGSGKSTLLHVLITALTLMYSSDEVELYLIDFKKGVEFKTYATHQLPHARVIAIESEREFGLSVLQGLDAELKRRGDVFRAAGVDDIKDYRQKSKALARVLLLVDEFQEFFTEDDTISSQSSQILDRLVRQGRAFGIHVLLGSQTLAGAYSLARSTIDQMAVRIALQTSEADSRLILADDNPAARLLSRPGEAIYNASNGMVEGNNRFQVAWLPDDERDQYLEKIVALAKKSEHFPPTQQIVFEGNAPAEVEKNRPLYDVLTASNSVIPAPTMQAWVGEPIAIRPPVAATFRRQSGSNLLVLGQSDESALGMLSVALVSLVAQLPAPNPQVPISTLNVLDFGAVDGPYANYFERLNANLGGALRIGRRREFPPIIDQLAQEVQRRLDGEAGNAPPLYLFIYGLQRARDLRQEDTMDFSSDANASTAPKPAQQFTTILREGPDVGVFAVVWCDTLTNLNRALDRRTLREFAMRVVMQMSAEDSANLIDTPGASKLGPYRALFYSEEEGRLEKFRPYSLPSDSWLEWVAQQLKQRQTTTA